MTPERNDNDKEFIRKLEKVEEIPLWMLENWYRGDDFRKEMVATALAKEEIDYHLESALRESEDTEKSFSMFDMFLFSTYLCKKEPAPPDKSWTVDRKNRGKWTETEIHYLKVDYIKQYMSFSDMTRSHHFMVNSASLKRWIDKNFQPVPDSEPEGPGSNEAKIIAEYTKKLYPAGYEISTKHNATKYKKEKKRIEKELKDVVFDDDKTREAVVKLINPEPKASHKKK